MCQIITTHRTAHMTVHQETKTRLDSLDSSAWTVPHDNTSRVLPFDNINVLFILLFILCYFFYHVYLFWPLDFDELF